LGTVLLGRSSLAQPEGLQVAIDDDARLASSVVMEKNLKFRGCNVKAKHSSCSKQKKHAVIVRSHASRCWAALCQLHLTPIQSPMRNTQTCQHRADQLNALFSA
jgi:hypothetical protein